MLHAECLGCATPVSQRVPVARPIERTPPRARRAARRAPAARSSRSSRARARVAPACRPPPRPRSPSGVTALPRRSSRRRRGNSCASMRSSTPPCPPSSVPESFTRMSRLISDSNRSPTGTATATTIPRRNACRISRGSGCLYYMAKRDECHDRPPTKPSKLLSGLRSSVRACGARTACRRVGAPCRSWRQRRGARSRRQLNVIGMCAADEMRPGRARSIPTPSIVVPRS